MPISLEFPNLGALFAKDLKFQIIIGYSVVNYLTVSFSGFITSL